MTYRWILLCRILFSFFAWFLVVSPSLFAAPGPGINQTTWAANEVGREAFIFPASATGPQPTMADFQHGYLYIGAANSVDKQTPGFLSWWDLSNPRNPNMVIRRQAGGNKPHVAAFWEDKMQLRNGRVWDFDDFQQIGTYSGSVGPVWYMGQLPFIYRARNGYGTGSATLEVIRLNSAGTSGSQIGQYDLGSGPGFMVGGVHAIGNLLVCSASQARGVATFDISNPGSPVLLDHMITGNDVYTSMVHGSRVYQGEVNEGIRVYDFADPSDIKLVGFIDMPGSPRYIMFQDGKGYCAPESARIVRFNANSLAIEQTWNMGGGMDFVTPIGNMLVTGGHQGRRRCAIVPSQQAPDTTGPSVGFVSPADGAQFQARTSRVGFTMSDQIDITSLNTSTLIVRPVGSNTPVQGTYSTQMGMINFAPAAPLGNNVDYEVVLPAGGIRDLVGNAIATTFRSTFSTGSGAVQNPSRHWPLDGSPAANEGNGGALVESGNPVYDTDAAVGSHSISLDGTDDLLRVPSLDLGNEFTISLWAKLPSPGETNLQPLFANANAGGTVNGFRVFVNTWQTDNRRILIETANGTDRGNLAAPVGQFELDQWNHVAVTFNRSGGTAQIYYNGTQVASGSIRPDFNRAGQVAVGAMLNGAYPTRGKFDDVRIFGRLLTAAEIAALADAGNEPPVLASITVSDPSPTVGTPVTVTAQASDPDPNDALTYAFSFGDNSPDTPFGSANSVTHTFTRPGRFQVRVRVRDGATEVSGQTFVAVHHPLTALPPTASSQIIHDPGRAKVWCVNPDSDSISRISAAPPFAKELEVPTAKKPRSIALSPNHAELWVACEDKDVIQIFNPVSGALLDTRGLDYGTAPVALAFHPNGSAVYVAARGSRALLELNPASRAVTRSVALPGGPFSVSVSGDGTRILAARLISTDARGEVFEIAPASFTFVRTHGLAIDTTPDTANSGRGLPNYLQTAVITPDGRSAWVPSKKDNIQRGMLRDGQALDHDNTVRTILSRLDLVAQAEDLDTRQDIDNHSLPGEVCFSPLGDLGFLAIQGSRKVLAFDTATGDERSSVATGHAPQSLCLDGANGRLFVLNFLSRSIAVHDVANLIAGAGSEMALLGETAVVASELLSAEVLRGKQIFYDGSDQRMSAEGYISCVSCHLDGGQDGRVWDFTGRGEGLRNTTDLRGRAGTGHGNIHWSGNFDEVQDFELDIVNRFGGTGFIDGAPHASLGAPNAGRSAELDALAAYVGSLGKASVPRSPQRRSDGSLSAAAGAGQRLFFGYDTPGSGQTLNCVSCHGPRSGFTSSTLGNAAGGTIRLHDVGTIKASSGQRLGAGPGSLSGIDTPSLLGLHDAAPYLHDGSATTIAAVFDQFDPAAVVGEPGAAHNLSASGHNLTTAEKNNLLAYLMQLDGGPVPNSDGDAFDDHLELLLHTDPQDAAHFFRLHIQPDPGGVRLSWPAAAGMEYSLEACDSLPGGTWSQLRTVIAFPGVPNISTLETQLDPKRHYRVRPLLP